MSQALGLDASGGAVVGLLAAAPLLSAATARERSQLAACATVRSLAPGQLLLLQGESSDSLYVVGSGRLRVLLSSERGEELVLSLLSPGEAFGELSVLDRLARSATVQASGHAEVVAMPGPVLRDLLQGSPALALAWAGHLAAQVRRLTDAKADLVFLDLPRRLAKLLLEAGTDDVSLGSSQTEVAARLGVARQSVNRALSALQQRGWLAVEGSRVVLRDRSALTRFAGS